MNYCESCKLKFPKGQSLCSKCSTGLKEVIQPITNRNEVENFEVSLSKSVRSEDLLSLRIKKSKSTKKFLVAALCTVILAAAVPLNTVFQDNRRIAAEERAKELQIIEEKKKAELDAQSLTEAFNAVDLKKSFTDCAAIQAVMDASAFPDLSAKAEESRKEIDEARAAESFVEANSISATDLKNDYGKQLDEIVLKDLEKVFSGSDRDDLAPETQLAKWSSQWKTAVLDSCNLSGANSAIELSLSSLDSEFDRITTLADSVPWYPEGYYEHEEDIAINWVKGAPNPCFTKCVYATLDLVARYGCPTGLYVEVIFSKLNGMAFDWSNDILPQLAPKQKGRLQFISYENYGGGGGNTEIAEISCR